MLFTSFLVTLLLSFSSLGVNALAPKAPKADGGAQLPTTFNNLNVPPIKNIDADGPKFNETISHGYWLVEFYSPYCHHCKSFAPVWQTLYELYYTSNPVPHSDDDTESTSLNTFSRYYNVQFGKVDCVAYGDTCAAAAILSFPSVVLFKDGTEVKRNQGYKDLPGISAFLEDILESIKPGSRPKGGLELPKVGADHSPHYENLASATKLTESVKGAAKAALADKAADHLTDDQKITSATKVKSRPLVTKPTKQQKTPNVDGTSVPLSADNFQRLVTTTRDPWFIKFYAPWCHHCQALAPAWRALAKDTVNKLNVGEVNCEVEKRLCKDVGVRGFPTLALFQGGERINYDGLRGLGDLASFAQKAIDASQGIRDVNAAQFESLEKTNEVLFLYAYDHATTSEDFAALERLQLPLLGHAKLVRTNDPLLYKRYKISTWPRLLVSRDSKPSYYTALAPKDMRDYNKVLDWMKSVRQPLVPELTTSNAREIMNNKLVVLGVLSRSRADEFIIAKREIKNAAIEWIEKQNQAFQLERQELRDAKQLRIEEAEDRNDQRALRAAKSIRIDMQDIQHKEVAFAWVDGVFWERWIKTTFGVVVRDGERVIINDESNHRYWDTTITGNPIVPSRTSILETLSKVIASPTKIAPKSSTVLRHTLRIVPDAMSAHPFLMFVLIVAGCGFGTFLYKRQQGRRLGFFQLPISKNEGGGLGAASEWCGNGAAMSGGGGGGVMNGIMNAVNGGYNGGKKD